MKTALLDCINRYKKRTIENYRDFEQLILQLMPSWWLCLRKCHHLSVNETITTVPSSLAAIYQCFNGVGFSYIPDCGWVKARVTSCDYKHLIDYYCRVGWMTH